MSLKYSIWIAEAQVKVCLILQVQLIGAYSSWKSYIPNSHQNHLGKMSLISVTTYAF